METESVEKAYDPIVFWVSATITVAFVIWSIVLPESMNQAINAVFNWTTGNWGWLYLVTAFVLVLGCFILMLGKYGNIKLGLAEDTPEFSDFSWFSMLFGSAIAAGIVFWVQRLLWYGVVGGTGIKFDVTGTLQGAWCGKRHFRHRAKSSHDRDLRALPLLFDHHLFFDQRQFSGHVPGHVCFRPRDTQ